jgi:hypothetical protein
MLALRKLTRAAADVLHQQIKEVLSAVAPLLQARVLLGDYVRGVKEPVRGADQVFREVQAQYDAIVGERPFGLRRELAAPLDLRGTSLELHPSEYHHKASADKTTKSVLVSAPFRWVLSYGGHSPEQLRALLSAVSPSNEEVHAFVLHYVALHMLVTRQPVLTALFRALRYGLQVETQPEFGKLPLVHISAPVSTLRPPDQVIIDTTEMTGSDNFEEVMDLDALKNLRDPLRDSLVELARSHGEKV